jgi:Zn-dependent M28 family amino/carboxypeptidase
VNIKNLTKELSEIGIKDYLHLDNLRAIEETICELVTNTGYTIKCYPYLLYDNYFYNYEVTIKGESDSIICIGAHYDTVVAGGANDNVSGVVGILYLLKYFIDYKPKHTLRFCFFVNEEPPHYETHMMGSYVYAKMCSERNDNIKLMIALDLIGCYCDVPDSQEYPPEMIYKNFPNVGNFIAVVGDNRYFDSVFDFKNTFRSVTDFFIECMLFHQSNFFSHCSDHGSFSKFDYPSILLTDTAFMRYKFYHTKDDTYDKLNYEKMELMLEGLSKTIKKIVDMELPL